MKLQPGPKALESHGEEGEQSGNHNYQNIKFGLSLGYYLIPFVDALKLFADAYQRPKKFSRRNYA
jgi:hypothetical protein